MVVTREEMTKEYLPKDIVMNILVRIPVKSIIRFKCVCKSWYALIANPQFITQHLTQSSSSSHETHSSILLFNYRTLEITWLSNENFRVSEGPSIPLLADSHVYGPCDGILCLSHGPDKIALWNPSTRECTTLSSSGLIAPQNASLICPPDFGFGFDSKTNDYKVVRILRYQYMNHMNRPLMGCQVEVYTLSTDSWRKIDTMVTAVISYFPSFSTYVKGFYYWRARENNQKGVILSFDMSNEVFQNIVLPPPTNDKGEVSLLDGLLELNGSIAAIYRTCDLLGRITIWVMNMNQNENKWIKHFTIDLQFPIRRVFASCKNKHFLVEAINCNNRVELVSYIPRTGEKIGHHGFKEDLYSFLYSLEVVICKESLVPLSRKKEDEH